MATRLQRKAFRKNAKRSTGPRTPEGKARSSQNACKHGLFARDAVLPDENPEEFLQLIADLEQELEARGDFERRLVHHIAGAEWRMGRLVRLETGALTSQLEKERLYAQRMQADLGKLNHSVQAKPGEQTQSVQAAHDGENQSLQAERGEQNSPPPPGPYQQNTKELGAVVAEDRDTPVLLTLSLYEARLTRKYLSLLKQLRLTQKLRRAAEALEPQQQPAETEVALSTPESPPAQQHPPTPSTSQVSPQPPLKEPAQAKHPPTPSTQPQAPEEEHPPGEEHPDAPASRVA